MKCLVKLALLTKAKMQVYGYLPVDNYSCVFAADILMDVWGLPYLHSFMGAYKKKQPSGPAML